MFYLYPLPDYVAACTPVGLLASYWNMPIFTWAATSSALSDKSAYTTLVRIAPPFSKMGAALYEAFQYFGWTRIVMVSQLATRMYRPTVNMSLSTFKMRLSEFLIALLNC